MKERSRWKDIGMEERRRSKVMRIEERREEKDIGMEKMRRRKSRWRVMGLEKMSSKRTGISVGENKREKEY